MNPIKKCEFCGKTGPAYTWDVTICPECHKTVSSNIGDCWKEIFQLRAKLLELGQVIERNQKDLPAEFSRLVDGHFWEIA
jgi:hypothetical protein